MKLRLLRYFLTVVYEGNITRAADALHITQPTLSRQLMQLEEELDTKLLIRGKREITLTEAGTLLAQRAEEILSLVNKTQNEIGENLISGTVSIGSVESNISSQSLSKLLRKFHSKYPKVKYNLYTGNANDIKQKIDKGLLDIGILLTPTNVENYESINLSLTERWGILMLKNSPLAEKNSIDQEEIADLPLITPVRSIVKNKITSFFGDFYDELNFIATYNLIYNAFLLVENGLGYAIAIESVLESHEHDKICFRPFSQEFTSNCLFIWKKSKIFNSTTVAFINLVKETYGN